MSNPFIVTTIHCGAPNCDRTKGANNHWFLAFTGSEVSIQISAWDDKILLEYPDDITPLCSDQCVVRMVSMYLSKQKQKSEDAASDAASAPLAME